MPSWLEPYLNSANPYFYPSLFGSLFLAGNGFPISADLVLITVSYLIYKSHASFALSSLICVAAILAGDTLMYSIGKKFGEKILSRWPFRKVFSPTGIARAKQSYADYGYSMVFAARFMPGIRTVFMFTSGLMNLSYPRFILADFLGAIIVVPMLLHSVTFVAGNQEMIFASLKKGQWIAFAIAACVFTMWIFRRRRFRASSSVKANDHSVFKN